MHHKFSMADWMDWVMFTHRPPRAAASTESAQGDCSTAGRQPFELVAAPPSPGAAGEGPPMPR